MDDLNYRLKETISTAVVGTDWAPPEGAILMDAVVIMGWFYADGTHGTSHFTCGSPWAGHGLVTRCLQRIEATLAEDLEGD